jgi:hypothetical protein
VARVAGERVTAVCRSVGQVRADLRRRAALERGPKITAAPDSYRLVAVRSPDHGRVNGCSLRRVDRCLDQRNIVSRIRDHDASRHGGAVVETDIEGSERGDVVRGNDANRRSELRYDRTGADRLLARDVGVNHDGSVAGAIRRPDARERSKRRSGGNSRHEYGTENRATELRHASRIGTKVLVC